MQMQGWLTLGGLLMLRNWRGSTCYSLSHKSCVGEVSVPRHFLVKTTCGYRDLPFPLSERPPGRDPPNTLRARFRISLD